MKVMIAYPPLESDKGVPLLSQNRQFQWFNSPTYIYPMVPAYAATMLKGSGHEVLWEDGIAEELKYADWLDRVESKAPDVIAMETKTPVVKTHWKMVGELKQALPETKVVLMGDHVTALPAESFQESRVDFVLTGGDYDFLLVNLANWLEGKSRMEPGIWYRDDKDNGNIKSTGTFELNHDLNDLPFIDRDLTKWQLYSEKNGNFKKTPGTYTMIGRDCWWRKGGGCTFCSWTTLYPKWRARRPELLADEIGVLIERYGVKSVFDDTGAFPIGETLRKFCHLMIERGYNKEIEFSCNMRFGALSLEDYKLMKQAGFRMLLFGLESAQQETLNRINKNLTVEQIKDSCQKAKEACLEPHLTIMLGYPWETREDAFRTFDLAKYLFEKGWADTLQATIVIPYPGTRLFKECKDNGLLNTQDWNEYDMRQMVMKSDLSEEDVKEITQRMYKLFMNPKYVMRKFANIRSFEDMAFILRGAKKVVGHLKDFKA
jgi:anaerobic magnesium-protoporphyrin IX monomethyl ester cyclase